MLGEILSNDHPDVPYRAQRLAVRNNIRALNVHTDTDDVIRRMPLSFAIDGKPVPAMAVELAARALGTKPEIATIRRDASCPATRSRARCRTR